MIELRFTPSRLRLWSTLSDGNRTAHVTGWADAMGQIIRRDSLAQHVLDTLAAPLPFSDILNGLNGNFAVVVGTQDAIHMAADVVRSIPLFYRQDAGTVVVSDDARLLYQSGRTVDERSAIELATAGYVTGPHTLFQEITGLQSGEWVSWSSEDSRPHGHRYYRYACSYDADSSVERLCENFDQALATVFNRLTDSLEGRQAIVPLSGGLDSRLVASMLKRSGYENVLCLSYGMPDNKDSAHSKAVAGALGYRWTHVPYSKKLWVDALSSEQMRDYWSYSSNGVSVPHCDDWPALRALRDHPEVSEDAVFLPGHTGDFISGGHLNHLFDPVRHDDPHDFNGAMLKKHHSLWENLVASDGIRDVIDQRLAEVLDGFPRDSDEDLACMYEYWEWQERQAKLIINSVRSYEFFGFTWRTPLWDREIMDFWRRAPLALKMDKYLYRRYLSSNDPTGLFGNDAPSGLWERQRVYKERYQTFRGRVRSALNTFRLTSEFLQRYDKLRRHLREYRHHPLGMAKAYGGLRYLLSDTSKRNSLSLLLRDFMSSEYDLDIGELVSRSERSATRSGGTKVPSVRP